VRYSSKRKDERENDERERINDDYGVSDKNINENGI
jgi:hypothetical protein